MLYEVITVARSSASGGGDERELSELSQAQIEKMVAQLEAEMRNAGAMIALSIFATCLGLPLSVASLLMPSSYNFV